MTRVRGREPVRRPAARLWAARSRWAFPALVLLTFVVLVALGVSGTSSGQLWAYLYGAVPDPHTVLGISRPVRSDEWLVVTPTLLNQAAAGFPEVNPHLGDGLDVSMVYGVPYRDWSALFKPEVLPFAFLPLVQAYAAKWWLTKALLALSAYAFSLAVLPGRRLFAALVAVGLLFAPFVQWWAGAGTDGPLAYALAAMATFAWLLRARRRRDVLLRSALLAYVTACFALLLYPPFQIPCALVAGAFCLGWAWNARAELPGRTLALRLGAAAASVAAGAVVLVAFVLTRRDVVAALSGTDYPGARVTASGGYTVSQLLFGFLSPYLQLPGGDLQDGALSQLGGNQSEASTFVLVGLLLVGVQVWLLVRSRRQGLGVNGVLVALQVVLAVFLAHLFLVSFDRPAHLLLLQLVPHQRLQIGLGLLSTALVVVTAWELHRQSVRLSRPALLLTGVAVLGLLVEVGARLSPDGVRVPWSTATVVLAAGAVAVLVVLLAGGRTTAAVAGLAAYGVLASLAVNPVYRGLFQVADTPVGQAIARADRQDPGAWVSTAGLVSNAVLVGSGVQTYSAAFGYPDFSAWTELDPDGRYRPVYNRYAHVVFQLGVQGPPLQNPQADVVLADFEPCGQFAQRRVEHVLTEAPADVPCLSLVEQVPMPGRTFYVYEVTPA